MDQRAAAGDSAKADCGLGRERRASRRRAAQENQDHKEIALQFHQQEREVAEARSIQQGLLPKSIPQQAGYEIAGAWQPAQSIGGDYYDVFEFDETTLGLCIADVAGKGLPAALLMSNLQAAVRGLASPSLPPDGLCARLNSLVCHNTGNDRFITFFYAQLDGPARLLRYTNAGHNAPIVLHRDGSHERLQDGRRSARRFSASDVCRGRGAACARRSRDSLYGRGDGGFRSPRAKSSAKRACCVCSRNTALATAVALQEKILAAAEAFSSGHWHDDATLLVVAVSE